MSLQIHIYDNPAQSRVFAEVCSQYADQNRDSLGFLPRSAYLEAAEKGNLFVAVLGDGRAENYAGHLHFGGRFPHLKIFQLYVDYPVRRMGVARQLLNRLVMYAERHCFLAISARVASDLPANEFWERMRFTLLREEVGGASRGRRINVRVRDLDSPNLFEDQPNSARLKGQSPVPPQPIYVADVNVFLDLLKDRERADSARRLIQAAFAGILRLFVSQEFVRELRRGRENCESDPVCLLAETLPQFPDLPEAVLAPILDELMPIIFPSRRETAELRSRELSDLSHLATTIHYGAAGFVTSDAAILRRADQLLSRYNLQVSGPAEVAELFMQPQWSPTKADAISSGSLVEVLDFTEQHRSQIEGLLESCSWSRDSIGLALAPGPSVYPRHRLVVTYAATPVAFASWEATRPPHFQTAAWLAVAPFHPAGELAFDILVGELQRSIAGKNPGSIVLQGESVNRYTREFAISRGFISVSDVPGALQKPCIGGVLSSTNWTARRASLAAILGMQLAENPPSYIGPATKVEYYRGDSTVQSLSLPDFERRFGPVIVVLPDRPVAVVPIQRDYADELLGTSAQGNLLPGQEARLWEEKFYFADPRTAKVLSSGTVILFYESKRSKGGRGAIVAMAQVIRSIVRRKNAVDRLLIRRGVLGQEEINQLSTGEDVSAIQFGHIMCFTAPVPIPRLRKLNCMDGANFVTARLISSLAAAAIIDEGQPDVRLR